MKLASMVRTAKTGSLILSLILCALGLSLLLKPDLSIVTIGIIVGWVLIIFGIVKLIGYFSKDLYRLAFQFDLAFGLFLMILGLIVLVHPHLAMSTLCVILGVEIIADCLFRIQTAMDAKRFGLKSWWLILLLAVLASAGGILMVLNPMDGALALAALLGGALLAQGIMNLIVSICAIKIVKQTLE